MPTLPISNALREAYPESISELYSRDVESLSDADIDRMIADQRANAERMASAEAAGTRRPREPKMSRAGDGRLVPNPVGIEELDL